MSARCLHLCLMFREAFCCFWAQIPAPPLWVSLLGGGFKVEFRIRTPSPPPTPRLHSGFGPSSTKIVFTLDSKSHLTESQSWKRPWKSPCPPPHFIKEDAEAQRGDRAFRGHTVRELPAELEPDVKVLHLQCRAPQPRSCMQKWWCFFLGGPGEGVASGPLCNLPVGCPSPAGASALRGIGQQMALQ